MLTVLKKLMWIRLSVVWEDLIILRGCSRKKSSIFILREKSVRSTSLFSGVRLFVHSTSVFCKLVGFVASSMIILVFNFYRFDVSRFKFDVVTFKGVKIQEEQIQKWREDIMLVPYLRSIKWLIYRTRLIHFVFSSILLATSSGWRWITFGIGSSNSFIFPEFSLFSLQKKR